MENSLEQNLCDIFMMMHKSGYLRIAGFAVLPQTNFAIFGQKNQSKQEFSNNAQNLNCPLQN